MANEEDKKQVKRLVDEANKQYLKAKSKYEKMQWAETHLPLLDQAIKLDRNNDNAWRVWGLAKIELGDHQGAIDDFTEAIKRNPKNDAAWYNRGTAKNYLGDHQGAIDDLTEAIKLNPKNDAAWHNRGVAKYSLGDFDSAISDFRKAIELNPKNDAIRQNLEAAEIAFASHENAKKPQQEKEEYHTRLKERARSHKLKFNILIMLKWLLFICIITIIFAKP